METERDPSPDVDKGWAFVMMLFGTVNVALVVGFPYISSIFYVIFMEEFDESPVITAWATNLNFFCVMTLGVVGNFLLAAIGLRMTLALGCVISTIGIVACSYATNIIGVLVTFGVTTGVGFSFALLPTLIAVPLYFEKFRMIAFSIVNAGAGLGQFLFAPLIRVLVDEYHWRGALFIYAAINLHLMVSAAVFMAPRGVAPEEPSTAESPKETRAHTSALKSIYSDLSMFRSLAWSLHSVGRFLMLVGTGGFLTHIFNFGLRPVLKLTPWQQTFLPSVLGIGSSAGRLLIGPFLHLTKIPVMIAYMVLYFILSVASIAISLVNDYAAIATSSFVAGIALGGSAIIFEVIIHIVGLKRYSSALSYSMLVSGIGFLLGGPFAAWIYEMDPSYGWSYRAIGFIVFISVILNIPAWLTVVDGKVRQRPSKEISMKLKTQQSEVSGDPS